jgi:hypothetical protein
MIMKPISDCPSLELQTARFCTDLTGENVYFDGFTFGNIWNGFACPYFTLEVGHRIVEATNSAASEWLKRDPTFNALHGLYDSQRDAFMFYQVLEAGSQNPEQDWDIFPAEVINEQKLYPIGTGGWAWSQEEP